MSDNLRKSTVLKAILFFFVIEICYIILMPTSTSVSIVTEETELGDYTDMISELKSRFTGSKDDFNVYIVKTNYVLKPDEIGIFVPYIAREIEDVQSSGNSEWNIDLQFAVYRWNGASLVESDHIALGETRLLVRAGSNTLMRLYNSRYSNPLKIDIHSNAWNKDLQYTEVVRVATVDSRVGKSELSKVSIQWDGNMLIHQSILKSIEQPFCVKVENVYSSNC